MAWGVVSALRRGGHCEGAVGESLLPACLRRLWGEQVGEGVPRACSRGGFVISTLGSSGEWGTVVLLHFQGQDGIVLRA